MGRRGVRSIVTVGVAMAVLVGAAGAVVAGTTIIEDPPKGTVVVEKVVLGDAGLADDATIRVRCEQVPEFGDSSYDQTRTVPAGTTEITLEFTGIPTPADCVVTEVDDGGNVSVDVEVLGLPAEFRLNPNEEYQLAVVNQLTTLTGSFRVSKESLGAAADERGDVVIEATCTDPTGATTTGTFVLGPGKVVVAESGEIVAGSSCTVVEVDDGAPDGVVVTTEGSPRRLVVEEGSSPRVTIVNTYDPLPGRVEVVKVVDLGDVRGDVAIDLVCGGDVVASFTVPSSDGSGTFALGGVTVPGGTRCVAVETDDGSTDTVVALTDVDPEFVEVPAGGTATITLTNTYVPAVPERVDVTVTKELAGDVGAQRGVVVVVSCDGRRGTILVPPGSTSGGSVTVTGVDLRGSCRILEPLDGATDGLAVTTTGTGFGLDPTAGPFTVVDTYEQLPGSVRVTKTVGGDAAEDRGPITIAVDCSDGSSTSATFEPGEPVTDVVLPGVEPGAVCTVTEPADGATATVAVASSGAPVAASVTAGDEVVVSLGNTYTTRTGTLVVAVLLRGNAEPFRDDVAVDVECDGREPHRIDAPSGRRVVPVVVRGLPYGTTCTVTQVADGDTPSIDVRTIPGPAQTVTIDSPLTLVDVVDVYTAEPGVLTVVKEVAGDAADRGEVVVEVACASVRRTATLDPSPDAPDSLVLEGLLPGEECTVSEPDDGATGDLEVVTTVTPAPTVVVGPGAAVTVTVRNEYTSTATPGPPPLRPPVPPVSPPDTLPVVGLGAVTVAGTGLAAIWLGVVLVAVDRRRDRRSRPPTT